MALAEDEATRPSTHAAKRSSLADLASISSKDETEDSVSYSLDSNIKDLGLDSISNGILKTIGRGFEKIGDIFKVGDENQEFLEQTTVIQSQDSSRPWNTLDFGLHFGMGGGRSVTLSEIGHLNNIISIAEKYIYPKLEKQIADEMRKVQSGSLVYRTERSYSEFKEASWALGNGVLKTVTAGDVSRDGDMIIIDASIHYSYSDEITDPLNQRQRRFGYHSVADLPDFYEMDRIPEKYRHGAAETLAGADLFFTDMLVGKAYSITGEWETEIKGHVFVKPNPEED